MNINIKKIVEYGDVQFKDVTISSLAKEHHKAVAMDFATKHPHEEVKQMLEKQREIEMSFLVERIIPFAVHQMLCKYGL